MTTWGNKMLAAVHTVSQMAAIGFGLPADAFTERMGFGPHLLAPTGTIELLLPLQREAVKLCLNAAAEPWCYHAGLKKNMIQVP